MKCYLSVRLRSLFDEGSFGQNVKSKTPNNLLLLYIHFGGKKKDSGKVEETPVVPSYLLDKAGRFGRKSRFSRRTIDQPASGLM